MPLSAAEKMKRYRERLKAQNPEKYAEQQKKNLHRIKSKKKKVCDMTEEELKIQRKKWRQYQHKRRNKNNKNDQITIPVEHFEQDTKQSRCIKNLRRVNQNLRRINQSQNQKIIKLFRLIEKYRKKSYRIHTKSNAEIEKLNSTINNLKARNEVLECTLKKSYAQVVKNKKEKLMQILRNSLQKIRGGKKSNKKHSRQEHRNIAEIKQFFMRDDISRNTAGKKETRTKGKKKEQIRYLTDTLKNLYSQYKSEGGKFGFSTFYYNKPFFVLYPRLNSRNTCLCVKHSNIEMLHQTLQKRKIIKASLKDTMTNLVCSMTNIDCMYGNCDRCKNRKCEYSSVFSSEEEISWETWERVKHEYLRKSDKQMMKKQKTIKAKKNSTISYITHKYNCDIKLFLKHVFNMVHQHNQYRNAIAELKDNEAVIVCDFSQNYEGKMFEEIQATHFGASKTQISLHTVMVYWKDSCQAFCTIANNLNHEPHGIWAHMSPIINYIQQNTPRVSILHFFSDGPSSQYRQKKNFYLQQYFTAKYEFEYTTWSFFESGHGKGVADGIGGTIKRTLDRQVCYGQDINSGEKAYDILQNVMKNVKTFFIKDELFGEVLALIADKEFLPIQGTFQLHQIVAHSDDNKLMYRNISCFCGEKRGTCSCHSPKFHSIVKSVQAIPETQILVLPMEAEVLTTVEQNHLEDELQLGKIIEIIVKDIELESNLIFSSVPEESQPKKILPVSPTLSILPVSPTASILPVSPKASILPVSPTASTSSMGMCYSACGQCGENISGPKYQCLMCANSFCKNCVVAENIKMYVCENCITS